jgi:putative endonuclease
MPEGTYEKGLAGEARAVLYLQSRGMVLLQMRYRSPFGEIDAVMRDADTLVFVEVKARNTGGTGSGLLSVNRRKQAKIIKTARYYLTQQSYDGTIRFDVIELTRDGVQHLPNAFAGSEF